MNITEEQTSSMAFTKYFIIVIVPLVSAFGLFGNLSFLYIVYHTPNMKTITNFYLVNLAIADTSLLVMGSFRYLWSYTHSYGLFLGFTFGSPAGCSIPTLFMHLCYFASVFLITLVTTERYLAICHTMRYRISRKRAIMLNCGAWVSALALASFEIPYFVIKMVCVAWPPDEEYSSYPTEIPVCFHGCEWCVAVTVYAYFIQYLITVPVITFMTISMVRRLRRGLSRGDTIRSQRSIQSRTNLVRMLQINALIFFLCLTPFEIYAIAEKYELDFLNDHQKHFISWLGRVTMLVNSAVNPLVYSVVNPSYRKAFQRACCRCWSHGGRTFASPKWLWIGYQDQLIILNLEVTVPLLMICIWLKVSQALKIEIAFFGKLNPIKKSFTSSVETGLTTHNWQKWKSIPDMSLPWNL